MQILRLPQAGRTMQEGVIGKWLVAEGQPVAKDQALALVETGDATIEVQASQAGTLLKVLAPAGAVVPVSAPIAIIGQPGQDVAKAMAKLAPQQTPKTETSTPSAAKPQAASVQSQAPTPQPTAKNEASPAPAPATQSSTTPAGFAPAGAVTPILMPQAGQSMEEGTILDWRVKVGDRITVGQIILEVETDKANIEVEAVDAGRIARIVADKGDIIPVKQPIAYLAENDADVDAFLAQSGGATAPTARPLAESAAPEGGTAGLSDSAATPRAGKLPVPPAAGGRIKASPAARKLAQDRNIDLSLVGFGSGPGGRIVTNDVPATAPAAAPGQSARRKLTSMRKAIAKGLTWSKQNIPHFYVTMTADAGPLTTAYQALKATGQFKCSVNDFVTAACAKAIREFPAVRSRLEGDEIVALPEVNVGIAVGTDLGLLVPVVQNADRLSFRDLAAASRKVVESARAGKLEGMGKGVFTITNLGMFGAEHFGAIINPPEVAILAVGAIREDVVVRDGAICAGKVVTMTLSADHRVLDGVVSAQFLKRIKELLESPETLLGDGGAK